MKFEKGMSGSPLKLIDNDDGTYSFLQHVKGEVSVNNMKYNYKVVEETALTTNNGRTLFRGKFKGGEVEDNVLYYKDGDGDLKFMWSTPHGIIRTALITDSGTVLVWTGAEGWHSNGQVWRSEDGVSFYKVLENIILPMHSSGVGSTDNSICFGTYGSPSGADNLYISHDDGENWESSLSLEAGEITHFHTCQWFESRRSWIATTGDGVMRWYESTNGGRSWKLIVDTNEQRFRTVGMVAISKNELVWSSDGSFGNEGVYYVNTDNVEGNIELEDIERRTILPGTSYGFDGWINTLMASSCITTPYKRNQRAFLYFSFDGGYTWESEKSYKVTSGIFGGFYDVIGPDANGVFYAVVREIEGFKRGTVIVTPNFN